MKNNKALALSLGIVLAAALIVGLVFGVKALSKSGSEPSAASTAAAPALSTAPTDKPADSSTETPADTELPTGSTEPEAEDPAVAAVKENAVYTDDELSADDARLDAVAAECGDYQINSRQAQIYYMMSYYGFLNDYGMYASMFGLDAQKSLAEQPYPENGLSWEQFFLMSGMDDFHQVAAAATKAAAVGYTLSEENETELRTRLESLNTEAETAGYESVDAYLQANLGTSARLEDYRSYLEATILAMSYQRSLYQGIVPTEEELWDYYDSHTEDFKNIGTDSPNVNVRHILIKPVYAEDADDDAKAAAQEEAKAKAEALLAEYQADPSEEHFAELANKNSEDPGSNTNGGLYEDVYPGQMVQSFNDWCFDAARQSGDTGIVETSYGYHIMYFVSKTDSYYWKTVAEHYVRLNGYTPMMEQILKDYPLSTHYENVVLSPTPQSVAE